MTNLTDNKAIDDSDTIIPVWIIKYCSSAFEKPIFLIWYTDTDENSTDKLLTYKSGNIFSVSALHKINERITKEKDNLVVFDNLDKWFNNSGLNEEISYDIDFITNSISKNNLDIPALESLSGFLDIFSDFVKQDENNSYLQVYLENELIIETREYYYDYIFWPRFNDSEKFETSDRPH
jgi:hypothetical protein